MKTYKFTEGPRYIRASIEDVEGTYHAVAFFDKRRGRWFDAASWKRPSHRLSRFSDSLSVALAEFNLDQSSMNPHTSWRVPYA